MLHSLKGRVALAAAIVIALGVAIATALQSYLSRQAAFDAIVGQHQAYTARVAADIDERLRLARLALTEIAAKLPADLLHARNEVEHYLTTRVGFEPLFQTLTVVSMEGQLVAAVPALSADRQMVELKDRPWFRKFLAEGGNPVVSPPFISRLRDFPVVVITVPIQDAAGALRGVLVGSLRLDRENLLYSVSRTHIGRSGYFVLATRDGTIVLHPDSTLVARSIDALGPAKAMIERALAEERGGFIGPDAQGARSLYSFHPVQQSDWMLIGIQPQDEALASVERLSDGMLLSGALLALLLVPAIWIVVAVLLRPLDHMRAQLAAIREGRPLDLRADLSGWSKEFSQVAGEFADIVRARRMAEQALRYEKERADAALRSVGDAVIITDRSGRVTSMNPAAERLTGWRDEEARGQPFGTVFQALHEQTGEPLENIAMRAMHANAAISPSDTTALRARDGRMVPVNDTAVPIHDPSGAVDGAVVVFRDLANERATAAELNWRARHDVMTGLTNRLAYEIALERLCRERRPGEQHAVLMLNLNQFKIVNDTCGYAAGDELLRRVARIVASRARKSDLVARLGGDEFALIMYHCPPEKALRIAEALHQDILNLRFVWEDKTYRVGASIGLVAVDDSYPDAQAVQQAADIACYMAKRDPRHLCLHSHGDHKLQSLRTEMQTVSRIHAAIEQDRLQLYAQRIMPISGGGDALHFEVLVRMIDEEGQLVPPGEFLPAAERYGLMDQIDRWVIAHALAACARHFGPDRWSRLDTVAINLSPLSLQDPSIVDYLLEQLERHGVPPRCVCIEVTETAAIENLEALRKLMESLRARGLRFALDDFGVGMTSLAQLRDLPVDILKIDGSFVTGIANDRVNGSMVYAIPNIARLLSMKTVAERVESEEELAHLEAIGVDYAQGYLLARPEPLEGVLRAVAA